MKKSIFFIPVILLLFISWNKQKAEWKGSIEVVDGVTIVKNPKEPMYGEEVFSIEEEFIIGKTKGSEDYIFSEVRDLDVDSEGRIFVLDYKETNIKVFDKSGKHVNTIGRKGQGPGEFQRPSQIYLTPQKEILVNDTGARQLHFFSLNGIFKRSVSQTNMTFFGGPKVDQKEQIVAAHLITDKKVTYMLKKFDSRLKEVLKIFSTDILKFPNLNPFFPRASWEITYEGNVIWGFPDKYELNIINSEGILIKKIIKDYNPVRITQDDKDNCIKERFGGYDKVSPGVKIVWDDYYNAYRNFTIDDEDRIFVHTYEKILNENGFYYDVFDSEGRYIAKIPLKVQPQIWKKNRLYTIEEDEDGYQFVKRYKVTWNY
jgi:hypothetical protein